MRRLLVTLAALAGLMGLAMAVERSPKVEGPQVRQKTEMERWEETPSARAAQHNPERLPGEAPCRPRPNEPSRRLL